MHLSIGNYSCRGATRRVLKHPFGSLLRIPLEHRGSIIIWSIVALLFGAEAPARAVPAFGAQTGQACQACHIGGFGPQLTPYGRAFKLGGYTQRAGKWNVPLSVMAIGSFTHTKADQNPPPTPDYASNNNTTLDQVSLFLAGGVGNHFGGFVQVTYDGVHRTRTWDNLDLRAVTTATVLGKDAVFGLSLNNSPGVQDVWNTLPAWGYPYTSSALAPSPLARPIFPGGFAQNTIGLTGYTWIDSKFYVEGNRPCRHSASTRTRRATSTASRPTHVSPTRSPSARRISRLARSCCAPQSTPGATAAPG